MSSSSRLTLATLTVLAACAQDAASDALPVEDRLGGETTVDDTSRDAFAKPVRNLTGERRDQFFVGNSIFNRAWVTAPASTTGFDGLGPTFNAVSCAACHFKDGRGAPPLENGEAFLGLLVRLSIPGNDEFGGPQPEPRYGGQLNPSGILGVPGEGEALVRYENVEGKFADGTGYTLTRPEYRFENLAYGPMPTDIEISPRVAPQMIGLGLLAALSEQTILERVDERDRDGDGISGRANHVWDQQSGKPRLGRFGWKANQPDLVQQTAGAFLGDMGITSELNPAESCTSVQDACTGSRNGGAPELDAKKLDAVVFYSHLLAVPAQRDASDVQVRDGQALFVGLGCAHCHVPSLTTEELAGYPELSNQAIHPYTDLLLHDMGEELADGRPDFEATGSEWRTPPLWGIGLFQNVNGHTRYLHDGRARDLNEAVLWHGGEADAARDGYLSATKAEREALLRFLNSL